MEKKIQILKIIDFLSSVEIFGKTILSPPQIHYFQEYKQTLRHIEDEEKLDLVLANVVFSINRLLKQIVVFGRNISIEQRKFLEKIEQFDNQNELNQFLNLLS